MSKRPSIKQQQKKQPDSLIQVVSEASLDDYQLELDLHKKLKDLRKIIAEVKNEIQQNIARLEERSKTIKQDINQIKRKLSELSKKKIINKNKQGNFSEIQGEKIVKNNKQEYTLSQIPVSPQISNQFLESNVNIGETRKIALDDQKNLYSGGESNKKGLSQGDSQLILKKQPPQSILQLNIEKTIRNLQYKQLQDISIKILPQQPRFNCLINHTLIEDYQKEFQMILPLLFQNILASQQLSMKCICGIKIIKSQIIEPRNRIIFESIMEKQLEVLFFNQYHLKCSNISCNYKFIFQGEINKLKPRQYCPKCDELCSFVFKL